MISLSSENSYRLHRIRTASEHVVCKNDTSAACAPSTRVYRDGPVRFARLS